MRREGGTRVKRGLGSLLAIAVVALTTAATALASGSGSVLHAYGGAGAYGAKLNTAAPQSGTLPFTGLDLGVALAVAVGLVVLGIVMRRAGRRTES
jgi:hypothetical protein